MRYLRPRASGNVPGVGFVHAGTITSVPDHLADELLATGEWQDAQAIAPESVPERVTEVPAPTSARPPVNTKKKGR